MPSDDRPTRSNVRALAPTRRVPAVMEDPPEVARSRRPTVKVRALDAGVYSIIAGQQQLVDRIGAH
jgi:hypothetical protein